MLGQRWQILRARPRPSREPGISTSGEHDAHLWGRLQNPQRFVAITRLQNLEARLGEKVRTRQTHKRLVLDDQDDMAGFAGFASIAL